MTKQKQTIEIMESIKNETVNKIGLRSLIEDLASGVEENDEIFRNDKFSLEVKNVDGSKDVILFTTYSNQEINKEFIDEMNILNIIKDKLNGYIF